jgi:GntR family transcriptional regulator
MLISLDQKDPRPIYLQIVAQIKEQIRTGELKPGDELPSVRELAESLGINLHTVHHAYQQLRDQEIIYLRSSQHARVAKLRDLPAPQDQVETQLIGKMRELITEAFHLGLSAQDLHRLLDEMTDEPEEGRETK